MKKTAILLSGGVDSLVAARLLKEQGLDIFGIHFITGYETGPQTAGPASKKTNGRTPPRARSRASDLVASLSAQLDIPVERFDCRLEFQADVVDYFIRTYQKGMTPSPCLVCNASIKFEKALDFARKLGASHLATGHYACVQRDDGGSFRLFRGRDLRKDQSYFLARLDQAMLRAAIFPLCSLTKTETVQLAASKKLHPVVRQESQDICFIPKGGYEAFLRSQPGFEARPGAIEDVQGNVIGRHPGLHAFTIGQRKGINCPASEPYYVQKIDIRNNKLIVGFKADCYARQCRVEDIHWIQRAPQQSVRVDTRIRYRHQAAPSLLDPEDHRSAIVTFDAPQKAVTPGQAAVFYDGSEVLGSGWIAEQLP